MQKSVLYRAQELSPEKRRAAEELLGGQIDGDELLLVRSSKAQIVQRGLTDEALDKAYEELHQWTSEMAKRVQGVPETEIEAAIDEAVDHVRHNRT